MNLHVLTFPGIICNIFDIWLHVNSVVSYLREGWAVLLDILNRKIKFTEFKKTKFKLFPLKVQSFLFKYVILSNNI